MKVTEGKLIGTGLNIAVIASRSHEPITLRLLDGAKDTLMRHDVSGNAIDIYRVPTEFELPLVAKELALTGKYDAIIALGAAIGQDPSLSAEALAHVALEHRVPVAAALERELALSGNKGADTALTAIETANLLRNIRKQNQKLDIEERTYNA